MKYCITTLLVAAISIRLRLISAFPLSPYSWGRRTLNTLLPVNVTSESTPQNTVVPSTNLTSTNVTFIPWPPLPFDIQLPSENCTLGIRYTSQWILHPPIDLDNLIDFISMFRDNLEEHYPPPAFAPRRAASTYIDPNFTRWTVQYQKSLLGKAIPTKVLLECLDELNILLRRHGPSSISSDIFLGTSGLFWSATLVTSIQYLASSPSNSSSPSGNYDFETS